jgi:hypothetical protein
MISLSRRPARIAVTEVDEHCVMITLDPPPTNPPPILTWVVQQHNKCEFTRPCSRPGKYARVMASISKTESDYRFAVEESVTGHQPAINGVVFT